MNRRVHKKPVAEELTWSDFEDFFSKPPEIHVSLFPAVAYVLRYLRRHGSGYQADILRKITEEHPSYRLSDTVLLKAIKFLLAEELIQESQTMQNIGVGRPVRSFSISDGDYTARKAELGAQRWEQYLEDISRRCVK